MPLMSREFGMNAFEHGLVGAASLAGILVGALFLVCAIVITTMLRPFVAQERDFYADI